MTKKYFCVARKWFDKINGNTYFNAKAIDENGKTVLYTGFQYGYGHQYYYETEQQLKKIDSDFVLIDLGAIHDKKRTLTKNDF